MRKNGAVCAGVAGALLAFAPAAVTDAAAAAPSASLAASPRTAAPLAAAAGTGAWTVYHRDDARTGFDPTQPNASTAVTGWTSPTLDGQVYASPLVLNGFVYAATLQGTVYALNQSTGAVAWSRNVGVPSPIGSGQCGNVNPLGILSTPVIDTAANRIYVSEILNSDHLWHVFGIDLGTHGVVFDRSIPSTIGGGFDWTIEQQRGALGIASGYVYVAFGGRAGDCGPYHGWVFGVPIGGGTINYYRTPSVASGIWAPGGVVIDDTTGAVFFSTGNAIPCVQDASDSTIRTNYTMSKLGYFQPSDWSTHWCGPDQDLASVAPVLLSPNLMFTTGKYGQAFLIDPTNPGGTDGQVYPARTPYTGVDVCLGNHSAASYGSVAYAYGRVYFECEGTGIVSLTVDTSAKTFTGCPAGCSVTGSWHAGGVGTLGSPIVAGGAVWAVSTSGGGLYGFNALTGAQIYHSSGFTANRFSTPAEAGGQIFTPAGTAIKSFNLVTGCSTVNLGASPASSAPTGSTVTLTATAGGSGCVTPQYRFLVQPPAGQFSVVQDWSASNTFAWAATGRAGVYHLEVDARDIGAVASYESYSLLTYTLHACTAVALGAAPPPPAAPGATVTLTASATCPGAAEYRFLVGSTVVQPYGASSTFGWDTTGLGYGTYSVEVDVRDQGATVGYEAWSIARYTLSPCASAGLGTDRASPQATGASSIGLTATASCPGTPEYRFLVGGVVVEPYGTTSTFSWSTAGRAPGTYSLEVDVRNQGSSLGYEAYAIRSFTLTGCSSAHLSADRSSPQPAGTTVDFTATSACPATPEYRFLVDGAVAQAYGASSTFAWDTTGRTPGTYQVEVDVRDQGSGAGYETWAIVTFAVS